MAKRKRAAETGRVTVIDPPRKTLKAEAPAKAPQSQSRDSVAIQIIAGSYERVLHGITATIAQPSGKETSPDSAQFADTFLFQAHDSAIRCLALSPIPDVDKTKPQTITLASGGTDDRINLYNISTSPLKEGENLPVPTLAGNKIVENPRNQEIGSLIHHSGSITALHFPSRSKLLSAGEDNTVSVTKTRDWTVVSTIKAPQPKVQGRPSGDTAPPGATPAGINDFAIHPSMKLMLSVGRSEKCMRLWNLVTGKKAGVLNFGREVLVAASERKWSSGEGHKITWDSPGEEFAVTFERGAVVFGIDCVPKCRIIPSPLTKLHQLKYIKVDTSDEAGPELLTVSTEDGRILFYSTDSKQLIKPAEDADSPLPIAPLLFQLGGKDHGQSTRIKDFEILYLKGKSTKSSCLIVTGSSDGEVKMWSLNQDQLKQNKSSKSSKSKKEPSSKEGPQQVGTLLGSYETGNRITCLTAFVMHKPKEEDDIEFEGLSEDEEQNSDDSSDSESEG